jgi:site-specific recombinase XerD
VCPKAAADSKTALGALASKYLYLLENKKAFAGATVRSYRVDLRQAFGDLPFAEADFSKVPDAPSETDILKMCRAALSGWSGLAPSSRNRKAAALKSFLHWLHEEHLTDRDLALQIHGPKVPLRLPHHLSMDEAMAVVKSLDRQVTGAKTEADRALACRDRALVLLLYGAGLRVSEACALEWSRIDGSKRVIRVKGKGSKERLVATPSKVLSALEALKDGKVRYVFGSEPLSTRRAYDIVKNQGARAGLVQPLHPHALRHSFATHLLSSGANLRTLQELLGHQTLQATQRYTHVGIDQLARTMEQFHPLGDAKPTGGKKNKS